MHPLLPPDADRTAHKRATIAIDLASAESRNAIEFLKAHRTVIDRHRQPLKSTKPRLRGLSPTIEPGANFVAPELIQSSGGCRAAVRDVEASGTGRCKYLAIVEALHRAGIPIMAGTDQTIPGHSMHREIELYVKAGFTPMEAYKQPL